MTDRTPTGDPRATRTVVYESDACQGNITGWDCDDCEDDACECECHDTEPTGGLRERFEGHDGRECGEHRTAGGRAWCFADSEWCSPDIPCRGCELPALRQRAEEAERKHAQALDAIAAERRSRLTAEAAVRRGRELHPRDDSSPHGPWCGTCLTPWPCHTRTALTIKPEEAP